MQERTQEIGAALTIESEPGQGTTITVDYPLPQTEEPAYA